MTRPISLVATLAICAGALAAQTTALNAQFQPKYDAFVRGFLNKDVKTVGGLLADDFNGGSADRPVTKQQTLDVLKKTSSPFKTTSRKVISVVINGNRASVIEDSVTRGALPDRKTKKVHQFEIQMRSMDTWEKGSRGWQIKELRKMRTRTLEDGKPFHADPNH